jgi:peptidoglycan/LPS O-acetylase OafA/YrhL
LKFTIDPPLPSRPESLPASTLLRPFYPSLDGARAIAFLMVFLIHYATMVWKAQFLSWGWAGVDLFFVLSGFLITGILYDSLHRRDYFRRFYIRRALRIFPLFYGLFLVLLLITPVLHIVWNRYNLALALYCGNIFSPGAYAGFHPDPGAVFYKSIRHAGQLRQIDLDPLWSLCVEEQFYLVWPAVIWCVRSRKALLRICCATTVLAPILRYVYWHGSSPTIDHALTLYMSPLARIDTLLMGAALALFLRGPITVSIRQARLASYLVVLAAPALLALCLHYERGHDFAGNLDPVVMTIGYSLIGLTAAGVILLALDPGSAVARALRITPLVALGRISYGMYILDDLPAPLFNSIAPGLIAHHVGFLILPASFLVITIAASLSFRYLESPFLRLKDRFAGSKRVSDPRPYQPPPG